MNFPTTNEQITVTVCLMHIMRRQVVSEHTIKVNRLPSLLWKTYNDSTSLLTRRCPGTTVYKIIWHVQSAILTQFALLK